MLSIPKLYFSSHKTSKESWWGTTHIEQLDSDIVSESVLPPELTLALSESTRELGTKDVFVLAVYT